MTSATSDLDPAVVEAGARAWFGHSEDAEMLGLTYDDLDDETRESMTVPVEWILTAALPILREQIAREVEARTPDGRKSQAFCAGMDRAARIVRGDS